MKTTRLLSLLAVSVLFAAVLWVPQKSTAGGEDHTAFTQTQRDLGGQDHALFPRLPGYRIVVYQTNDRATGYLHNIIEKGRHKGRFKIEGQVTNFTYEVGQKTKAKTGAEIKQHYRAIVKKLGGDIIYESATDLTAKIKRKAGGDGTADITWLYVHAYTVDAPEYYVTVVEQKEDR